MTKSLSSPHLLIAGTGRAGTSFLVKYLSELGLETHLTKNKDAAFFELANAGFEDTPLIVEADSMPYVAKSPWLYQVIDQLVEEKDFKIDGVIIPIRDLVEAATSRSTIELQNMHRTFPNMTKLDRAWSEWGATPGGIVYSADPLDQARILALGLHHLVEKLTERDIPFVFISFPRFIEDPEYLFKKLKKFLPKNIDKSISVKAHKKIADKNKVRTSKEIKTGDRLKAAPGPIEIENYALKRELDAQRENEEKYTNEINSLQLEKEKYTNEINSLKSETNKLNTELNGLHLKIRKLESLTKQLNTENRNLEKENSLLKSTKLKLEETINNMLESTSWKITQPVRKVKKIIRE